MIQMVLTGLGKLEIQPLPVREPGPDEVLVDVLACAVCRTDAKMWVQGQRDLVFPRVLGHEMVVLARDGQRFLVWPGTSCGTCSYCRSGRENLCDEMKIIGFHRDGGFAHKAVVPLASLIPAPDELDTHVACFAEPVGCVVNAFDQFPVTPGKRILVYGGGTMGLITAIYARHRGLEPFILEKDEVKIQKIAPVLAAEDLACAKETHDSRFDIVINACPDYIAFSQALTKVDKGGHFSFFSGITKNESIETNLLNLIHYKEIAISGAYGMKKSDMERGVPFLISHEKSLARLIEGVVQPEQAPQVLPKVLKGKAFKYILDFTGKTTKTSARDQALPKKQEALSSFTTISQSRLIMDTIKGIDPAGTLGPEARAKMDDKSKPLGSLGKLEGLGVQMAVIQNSLKPAIRKKAVLVFAADHGVTEEGVSAFPREVTGQMVDNFLNGGAAINVICRCHGIDMKVVDMGVDKDFSPHPDLIRAKVASGTRNMALEPAMTRDEAVQALENGIRAFAAVSDPEPPQILGLGEMGIGNTTSATAIICAVTGLSPAQATGRGIGLDNKGLSHKAEVVEKILHFHAIDPEEGLDVLMKLGGFELAGIAGAALAAASKGCAVVLDGVISTAAGLLAYMLCPQIRGYLICGHKSVEPAQAAALEYMGLEPVMDLDMRLGEATGAALAIELAQTACRIMSEMASFDEAKISRSPAR